MRRVLTILTAIVLVLVSLGVGVFTADLPFWRRALQLPLPEGGVYLPTARIGVEQPRPIEPALRVRALCWCCTGANSPWSVISSPTTPARLCRPR
jgi:hypothetical protein